MRFNRPLWTVALGILLTISGSVSARAQNEEDQDEGKKCTTPVLTLDKWENYKTAILKGKADPEGTFTIEVGTRWDAEDESKEEKDPRVLKEASRDRKVYDLDPIARFRNVRLTPEGVDLPLSFDRDTFARLIGKEGDVVINFKSSDNEVCEERRQGQKALSIYSRHIADIEVGGVYSVKDSGGFDGKGEAAVRFSTRWGTYLTGAVEFRYAGLEEEEEEEEVVEEPGEDGSPNQSKAESDDSQFDFNPFEASSGILQGDFYLLLHPDQRVFSFRRLPSTLFSFVGGFGLSTLSGGSGLEDFAETKGHLLGGVRLSIPKYRLTGADDLGGLRGYIQFAYSRDDLWKFDREVDSDNDPSTPATVVNVDERDRFVVQGQLEFAQLKIGERTLPFTARVYWNTPWTGDGVSDLRISTVMSINFFAR